MGIRYSMLQLKNRHNLHIIFLPLIIAYLIFFSACINDSPRRIPPSAVNGILDLTDWDFKKDGPVDLIGEYEFYWSQHLSPSDFLDTPLPERTGFIKVPGYWKDHEVDGVKHSRDGYATYRLSIILNEKRESLAFRIREISVAYTLYINGKYAASLGIAGENRERTVPRQLPQIVDFEPDTNRVEIILQVSNFHHRRGGGPWEVIDLGTEKEIRETNQRQLSLELFLFGSIFIIALYHLGLFLFRKKDRSPLYFSIFCFLMALRLLTTGGRYLAHLFPQIGWELLIKFEFLSFYLAVPTFALFMYSLFPKYSKRFLRLLESLAIIFAGIVVFTPARIYTYTVNAYEVVTIVTLIYSLYVIIVSLSHKKNEAFIFLIGFLILGITTINDMLHVDEIIQTGYFAPFGFFFFILSQAILLSYRFSSALIIVETQQKELKDTLESLKAEIIDRVQAEKALSESEEKYRTILHSIQEAYYEVDLAGNLTFFNDSLCKHLKYSKDELMGMNNRQFTSKETVERVYKTFNSVFKTGKATTAFDWEMVAKDGTKKFVELSVALIQDSEGHPVGFRGVARDISERKKAEEQARLHQQQLMQASKMVALGTLVSGVAHEVNNPNNFIMLNSPILKEAWDNAMPILQKYYEENGDFLLGGMNYSEMRENIPSLFTGISDGAKRIKQIVDDLKNYVRDNTADLTQSVDINEVLQSAVSLLSNMIKKSTNRFSIEYGKNLPLLRGNFQRLEQVLINLIQNACQALQDAKKGIFISVQLVKEESNIVINVRDEGMGIPPETLLNITDPFFTTKHEFGGVGLGLSISSKIVEEHGGTLNFESEIGAGTNVEIKLPVESEKQTVKGKPE
jgi:PAS domain S-box-containing protein